MYLIDDSLSCTYRLLHPNTTDEHYWYHQHYYYITMVHSTVVVDIGRTFGRCTRERALFSFAIIDLVSSSWYLSLIPYHTS